MKSMNYWEIIMNDVIQDLTSTYLKLVSKRETFISELNSKLKIEKDLNSMLTTIINSQKIVQLVAADVQNNLKFHIENIVQMALDAVFPSRYVFHVSFETRRNKTEAVISLLEGKHEIDPMTACGGGIVDIIALALRITVFTLGSTRNTIIFDEPLRFVSKDLEPKAIEIIKKLSKELHIQFIIVTHSQAIIESADKIFQVKLNNKGESYVECTTNN